MKSLQYRILVVDDSKTQMVLMKHILEKNGWEAVEAETGEEALEVLSREKVDMIILDYHLPGINGDELCHVIRTRLNIRSLPILLFAVEARNPVEKTVLQSGADDYISKAADEEFLVLKIKSLLNRQRDREIEPILPEQIDLSHYKILAVDDSPTFLGYLFNTLVTDGFNLDKASSGEEALEMLNKKRYDCILVDLLMPGMNGIELCRHIAKAPENISNPVVTLMLTEHENKEYMTQALEAGADDFVGKSSEMSVLKARIRALLRRKFIQEENQRIFEELKTKEIEVQRTKYEKEIAESKAVLAEKLQETVTQLEEEITRRTSIEEELLRSNADLEQFAYAASHDLKEPLRIITSFVELLKEEYEDRFDEKGKDFISRIVRATERMYTMIDDLLDFSRVNRLGNPFKEIDAEEIINEACENLKLRIQEKKAEIHFSHLPRVVVDHVQFVSVFQNLISNALKYCEREVPRIKIEAIEEENRVLFTVSDNGIGIEEDYFSKIFEIFQRLHGRSKYSGTGIGLAVVKKIIERHNGRIWVESTPGEGSSFKFYIPKGVRNA